MELIKILFLVVSSFFGVKESLVLSEKTIVNINPEEKTIVILRKNIVSIIQNESDNLKVRTELAAISKATYKWSSEFKDYTKKEKRFFISKDTKALNSKIRLTYNKVLDLKVFGIELNKDGKFSMTNFPKSHTKSADGELGKRYWISEANKTFSFTEEPLTKIPEAYKKFKRVYSLFG